MDIDTRVEGYRKLATICAILTVIVIIVASIVLGLYGWLWAKVLYLLGLALLLFTYALLEKNEDKSSNVILLVVIVVATTTLIAIVMLLGLFVQYLFSII